MIYPEKKGRFVANWIVPALEQYPEFSALDLHTFAVTFRTFDVDGSGSIDADELTAVFKQMGQGASKDDVQELLEQFDADNSGGIEWLEFLEMMRFFYSAKKEDYVKEFLEPAKAFPQFNDDEISVFVQTFRMFDLDDSGSIDANELATVFAYMGMSSTPEVVAAVIEKYDADGSGEIEWNEFLQMMADTYGSGAPLVQEDAPKAAPPAAVEPPKATESPIPPASFVTETAPKQTFKVAAPTAKKTTGSPMGTHRSNACPRCGKTGNTFSFNVTQKCIPSKRSTVLALCGTKAVSVAKPKVVQSLST